MYARAAHQDRPLGVEQQFGRRRHALRLGSRPERRDFGKGWVSVRLRHLAHRSIDVIGHVDMSRTRTAAHRDLDRGAHVFRDSGEIRDVRVELARCLERFHLVAFLVVPPIPIARRMRAGQGDHGTVRVHRLVHHRGEDHRRRTRLAIAYGRPVRHPRVPVRHIRRGFLVSAKNRMAAQPVKLVGDDVRYAATGFIEEVIDAAFHHRSCDGDPAAQFHQLGHRLVLASKPRTGGRNSLHRILRSVDTHGKAGTTVKA